MIYKSTLSKWKLFQHIDADVYPEFKDWKSETFRCPYCGKDFAGKYHGRYDKNCDAKNWMIHITMKHRKERAVIMLEKLSIALGFGGIKRYTEEEFESKIRSLRPEIEAKMMED